MTTPSVSAAALISRHFAAAAGVSRYSLPSSPVSATTSSFFFQAEDGIRDLYETGVQTCALPIYILNHMVQYNETHLDASFAALSDATRRGVLEQLSRADASITDLAGKFHMTLTGMKKHVGVLERAALVTTEKAGRVRTCRLGM